MLARNSGGLISIGIPIPCLKNHATNREEAFIYEERHGIGKSLFKEVSSSSSLMYYRCFRKANAFSDFRFEDRIQITPESTCRRSLCVTVVHKVLNSKAEIDLAFFLTLILFSLVTIGK